MKKTKRSTILFLLIAIISFLVLIATTDLLAPVMQFVLATDQGTPLQLLGCVLAAVLGFRFIYVFLNMVGGYYAGELDAIEKEKMSTERGAL